MLGQAKSRSAIFYSISGGGKTSELCRFAKWIWSKYHLRSRLISASPGGWAPFEDAGLIDADNPTESKDAIVQAFDITYSPLALAAIRQLSEGYWPRMVKDKSGKVYPHIETDPAYMTSVSQWNDIGAYLVEGTTDVSDLLLNHIRNSKDKVAFKASYEYNEGGYQINGLQEGHYGLVQLELDKVIRQGFHRLPISWNVWTAMYGAGEDKNTGADKIYGPKGAGQATTPQIPGWFGDCFHLDQITVDQETENPTTATKEIKQVVKRVAWYQNHIDRRSGLTILSKCRLIPELMPSLYKLFPGGYVELTCTKGIEQYFNALDEIREVYRKFLVEKGEIKDSTKKTI